MMAAVPDPVPLSPDLPLATPDQDRLGYAAFAGQIAAAVRGVDPAAGIVLGLHGAPGSGRTSVVNFVRGRLADDPDIAVADLNPWTAGPGEELSERLAALLGDRQGRALVVMDDLDRAGPERIREVIRLTRAVAALPGVVYLLVFDRTRVPAEDVAKLVQVPFDLPLPEPGSLAQLFLDHLRDLLDRYPPPPVVTQHHFDQTFSPGIETLLRTPRDVVRLVNALQLSYPPLSQELNTADFVALEALRLFEPSLYDLIRRTPERFAGTTRPRTGAGVDEATRRFHEGWVAALEPDVQLGVATLVLRLFPAVPDLQSPAVQREAPGAGARQELRVASPELYSAYFQFAVPATTMSNAELEALLGEGRSREGFAAVLRRLAGERDPAGVPRLLEFLGRLGDRLPELGDAQAAAAVGGLLAAADDLGDDVQDRLDELLARLLRRLEPGRRRAVLEAEAAHGAALGAIVAEVARLGREHGRHGGAPTVAEGERTVDAESLAALEGIALRRIRDAAAAGRLAGVPRLPEVLGRWLVWDRAECLRWVARTVESDDGLVTLVMAYRTDPRAMRPLVEPHTIMGRVRRLAGGPAPSAEAQAALEGFVLEYDLRQEQRDPAPPAG
jgi:predicted KAP-like P-loop ATPase